MKQEQFRSNPEGGSYEDGMKAGWLIQLAERASWTAHLVQLARSASWTARSIQLARSASWTTRSIQLTRSASWTMGVSLSGVRCLRSCVNPFRNCYEAQFRLSRYFLTIISFFLKRDIFLRNFPTLITSWSILTPTPSLVDLRSSSPELVFFSDFFLLSFSSDLVFRWPNPSNHSVFWDLFALYPSLASVRCVDGFGEAESEASLVGF